MTRVRTTACITLTLAWLSGACAGADTLATAEDLFGERAYAEAATFYLAAAQDGSAPAMMRLGLMADSGLGQDRSPETAFEWYRRAASQGLSEAMFNVAIMHDAGIGTERSAAEAYIWYSRAALRGHGRAQYNLGLLFDAGIGVPNNRALAQFWFARAAGTIPAAAQKLATPQMPARTVDDSDPRLLSVSAAPDGLEVIWQAGSVSANRFLVELAYPRSNSAFPRIETYSETGSALLLPLSVGQQAVGVRVTQIAGDGAIYRRSDWRSLQDGWSAPQAQVLLRGEASQSDFAALANILTQDLAPQRISLDRIEGPTPQTRVRYGFAQDASLAHSVAGLLPLPEAVPVTLETEADLLPGQIALDIRTDPAMAAAADNDLLGE